MSESIETSDMKEAKSVLEGLAAVFQASGQFQKKSGSTREKSEQETSLGSSERFEIPYRLLIEQIPAVVFLAFLDREVIEAYVSPHIEAVLGFSQEEWLNDPVRWYRQIHPDDRARWNREAADFLASSGPLRSIYRVVARDGQVVWFHCEVKILRRDDGEPWLVHGVAFDVTELKQAQHALLQAQKMESIGTLAAGIAHDFNNILNIIQAYASLIEDGAENRNLSETVQVITDSTQRGANLVRQLLSFARKVATRLESTHINRVIRELANLLKETIPRTIEIQMDLDPRLPPIMADPNQLTQALLNLSVNARDAMPTGGTLKFTTGVADKSSLRKFPDAKAESYVCIEVADTGAGIDKSIVSRIFDPFFTTKGNGQGTGLGLAVVYGIVKDHHGFIDLTTETGKGATFKIFLPCGQISSEQA